MKHVKKSVLLWYSPREMYALVAGIRQMQLCRDTVSAAFNDFGF